MKGISDYGMRDMCIGSVVVKFQKLKKYSTWISKSKGQNRDLGLAQGREGAPDLSLQERHHKRVSHSQPEETLLCAERPKGEEYLRPSCSTALLC